MLPRVVVLLFQLMPPKRKRSSAAQRSPAKRTRVAPSNEPPHRERRQENLSTSRQTRQSSRSRNCRNETVPTESRSANQTTSSSIPTPTNPPSVPANSSTQSTVVLAPQDVLCQLSNVLQQLTSTMQANAPLPYHTNSVHNATTSTPEADDLTDALSEASIQQQLTHTPSSVTLPINRTLPGTVTATSNTRTLPGIVTTTNVATRSDVSLPPVPPRIKEKIISGEFVDLATLLPSAMFSGSTGAETSKSLTVQLTPLGNDLSVRPQPSSKKISSFASWMEAWNTYLAILINHSPVRAPQLVAYQRIITSASTQYPLAAWLNYDVQFRTLAASDPSLRWDTRHTDLWLQCVTAASNSTIRWPCSHCGATNHYPRNCPFRSHTIPTFTDGQRSTITSSSNGVQQLITGALPNSRPSTCHAFNRSTCRRQNCSFLHQCESCGADHSAKYCPNRGSTAQ